MVFVVLCTVCVPCQHTSAQHHSCQSLERLYPAASVHAPRYSHAGSLACRPPDLNTNIHAQLRACRRRHQQHPMQGAHHSRQRPGHGACSTCFSIVHGVTAAAPHMSFPGKYIMKQTADSSGEHPIVQHTVQAPQRGKCCTAQDCRVGSGATSLQSVHSVSLSSLSLQSPNFRCLWKMQHFLLFCFPLFSFTSTTSSDHLTPFFFRRGTKRSVTDCVVLSGAST
jgi:hypothetical protein